jgi:hypothetical protein
MRSRNQSWHVLRLLGATAIVLGVAASASAATEQVLYPFSLNCGGGAAFPNNLVFDAAGNLYGAAGGGGIGYGAIFALAPSAINPCASSPWTPTILHDFSGNASDGGDGDGANPGGAMVFDAAGNLYGTTSYGGGSGCGGDGCGVIFELSPTSSGWTETILYTFTGGEDGGWPQGLTADSKGNLYGTAYRGGSTTACDDGCGTVFMLARTSKAWDFRVLHSFTGSDGEQPSAVLAVHSGSLYGTAAFGGNPSCTGYAYPGCGTVFMLTPAAGGSVKFEIIHSFSGGSDGSVPVGGIVLDQAGNIFGTTNSGGAANYGAVFGLRLGSTGWEGKLLYSFAAANDGRVPSTPLTLDQAGNIYGTTTLGGTLNNGVYENAGIVFELTPKSEGSWTETILHNFTGGLDGQNPSSGVIFDTAGNMYGSTTGGGSGSAGTVYEITP